MSDEEDFEEQLRLEQLEVQKSDGVDIIEHGRIKKDEDGTEFEWDAEKRAWFPRINDDFIASYQMQYGSSDSTPKKDASSSQPPSNIYTDPNAYWKYYYGDKPLDASDPNYAAWYAHFYGNSEPAPTTSDPAYPKWYYKQCYGVDPDENNEDYKIWAASILETESSKTAEIVKAKGSTKTAVNDTEDAKAKKKKPEPKWFEQEDTHNTSVYVQGLPDDITEEEFKELMSKCGLIAFDYDKKKLKLKLYVDKETQKPKGDGLCTYIKRESVDLALQLLDESDFRGSTIGVQLAKFELKGDFDPKLRRKPKNNKMKRREKEKQSKLLDWRPDKLPDERFNCEKTVVLKNMFEPAEFDANPATLQEIRDDLRQECSNFGEIKKITIYDRNPDGVVTVTYKEFEDADLCVASLNHRWFAKRRILASNWNGRERFEIKETPEQEAERLRKWDEYLESGGEPEAKKVKQDDPAE